jgi:rhomboid protease GluP
MTVPDSGAPAATQPGEVRVPVVLRANARKPTVTYVLMAVTIVIYGLQFLSEKLLGTGYDLPFFYGGKINEFILQGQVWRLITPALLHGSIIHLAFNMYALFIIGPSLERFYGHKRFFLLYLIGAYAGNVLSFLLSANPSLGASTAVFGLVAAEAVFIYRNKKMYGSKARSMLINLMLIIAVNLFLGLSPNSSIDNWGHLGGLVGGLIFSWFAVPFFALQTNELGGYELTDISSKQKTWWGLIISVGLFTILVILKFILR